MIAANILLVLNFLTAFGKAKDNLYKELPSIFHIDDYEKCKMESKLFCKVSVTLKPLDNNISSKHWKMIEHSIENKYAYNHDELFHAICVNDFCPEAQKTLTMGIEKTISECYQRKFSNSGLVPNIANLKCDNVDTIYEPTIVDYVWILFIVCHTSYVLIATYWDHQQKKSSIISQEFGEKYFLPFSIIKNYQKFRAVKDNEDFQKLKCIQGIRFYNMLLIIFCHTFSSFIGGYVMNTEYIENISNNPFRHGLRNLMVFLVQTFFLFSSFLMSYHFFQVMENKENEQHKLKVVLLTFFNRYLRILPPVLIMVGWGSTVWVVNLFYGPVKDQYADPEHLRCQKNWWASLLFIHNHYNQEDMCYFTTWYLAADTQLYLLSLIILTIIWINRNTAKHLLSAFVALGVLIPTVICYIYDLDMIFRITPENSKINKFRSVNFHVVYSSTYSNMATYMIGLCFGYFYFTLRNVRISFTRVQRLLWFSAFLGLPLLVVTISSNDYPRLLSAIFSGTVKPVYAIGIGFGVFGMSRGEGGAIRSICEWKPAVILGSLTYSTYIFHYVIVFSRTAAATQPFYMSDYIVIKSFIRDATLSFLCGLVAYIFVELPATNMQNMCIPQVRWKRLPVKSRKTN
ncbi:O-acyltransferase like protein-like [Diabrotica virgifera virgifera]|uniref:Acyltransferase 3 domain-containing protein n=1 Tax=Diabrotica virgifera virgifera TaxID=50390 RepID=A0ABM5L600_DIAVI|nr:O-acyltransferase like protein-like [Diabrotica virgifera virgifera]